MTVSLPISEQPAEHERRAALGKVYRYLILKARERRAQPAEAVTGSSVPSAANLPASQPAAMEMP